jgi:lipopolysaccharide/colanic/teichoic acid biosynthesis glycosyltransferase
VATADTMTETYIEVGEFADLVEKYALSAEWPDADWLTRLDLQSPRLDVRCLDPRSRLLKRVVDIVGSITLLVLLTPIGILIPILIKLTSGAGPVIFKQTRVGLNLRTKSRERRRDEGDPPDGDDERRGTSPDRRQYFNYGKPFTLYKFRTMRNDAEEHGAQFASKGDQRVTWLGRFMRRTRIDETPQLLNVLRGEMSLVGPRPERPVFVDQLSKEIPNYLNRLGLRPGLSGIAQIENGYDNDTESFRRKVAYDLLYLQNCCVRNDLKILWRTISVVITGKGAL